MKALALIIALTTVGCTTPTSPSQKATCVRADASNAASSGLPVCK